MVGLKKFYYTYNEHSKMNFHALEIYAIDKEAAKNRIRQEQAEFGKSFRLPYGTAIWEASD